MPRPIRNSFSADKKRMLGFLRVLCTAIRRSHHRSRAPRSAPYSSPTQRKNALPQGYRPPPLPMSPGYPEPSPYAAALPAGGAIAPDEWSIVRPAALAHRLHSLASSYRTGDADMITTASSRRRRSSRRTSPSSYPGAARLPTMTCQMPSISRAPPHHHPLAHRHRGISQGLDFRQSTHPELRSDGHKNMDIPDERGSNQRIESGRRFPGQPACAGRGRRERLRRGRVACASCEDGRLDAKLGLARRLAKRRRPRRLRR